MASQDWEMHGLDDDDGDYNPELDEGDDDEEDNEIQPDYEDDFQELQDDLAEAMHDAEAMEDSGNANAIMNLLNNMAELEQNADGSSGGAESNTANTQDNSPEIVNSSTSSRLSLSLLQLLFHQPVRVIQSSANSTVSAGHRHQTRAQTRARDIQVDDEDEEEDGDNDDDDDEDNYYYGWYRRPDRPSTKRWFSPVEEPQPAGVQLIAGGEYGRIAPKLNARRGVRNIAKMINTRGNRVRRSYREDLTNEMVPNTNGVTIAAYDHNIYSAQFSADSSFYYTCAQDFRLHIYDMTAPPTPIAPQRRYRGIEAPDHQTSLKVHKVINGHPGRWTITDSHLSPDNERIIYSSLTPTVYLATTRDSSTAQHAIRLSDNSRSSRGLWGYDESFGIYSCRFSADGNEVIAGGSGRIFVYDLLADKRTVKINAHTDDVNSCCWADTASGNVLVSASDDTFLKVWDRRSLGSSPKPSGVLIGHTEGITNVSAKGDGRYIISNGKDQSLRLWDLRKMRSNAEYEAVAQDDYGIPNFDYRYSYYPQPKYSSHPRDCSVMTYRGHSVMSTLIRCHFSPAETTGSQYIYSGSADGRVHIWSLDGRVVQVLDRARTLPLGFDPSGPEPEKTSGQRDSCCVRDVSWHSREPVLFSAGWESRHHGTGSTIARHEWKGLSKVPGALEDYVTKQKMEKDEKAKRAQKAQRRIPGMWNDDDDEGEVF